MPTYRVRRRSLPFSVRRTARVLPYEHIPRHVHRALKAVTIKTCDSRCVYCGERLNWERCTLDHVIPRALGGRTEIENLVASCGKCNTAKRNYSPERWFARNPEAARNFVKYARTVPRSMKREARRALSLAMAGLSSRAA